MMAAHRRRDPHICAYSVPRAGPEELKKSATNGSYTESCFKMTTPRRAASLRPRLAVQAQRRHPSSTCIADVECRHEQRHERVVNGPTSRAPNVVERVPDEVALVAERRRATGSVGHPLAEAMCRERGGRGRSCEENRLVDESSDLAIALCDGRPGRSSLATTNA
jgi:hypothetical protein